MDKTRALERLRQLSPLLDECMDLDGDAARTWIQSVGRQRLPQAAWLQALVAQRASSRFQGFLADGPRLIDAPHPLTPTPSPGCKVGPYELVRQIGRGGMSTVWLARQHFHRRPVAIKLHHMANTSGAAERVEHERRMTALMAHRRVARLRDHGVDERFGAYLVFEYIEGTTLQEGMGLRWPALPDRLALFLQMAEAVAHVHDRGVVHRDLKPSNFIVTARGVVHLIDFGIAMPLGTDPAFGALAQHCLTPAYASPEHRDAQAVTPACDVYSLGVILCELITGHRPGDVREDGSTQACPVASLPLPLRSIVQTALAPRASERYAQAGALASAVRQLVRGPRRDKAPAGLLSLTRAGLRQGCH